MIEAYKIAVNMNLKGDAQKKMKEFSESVKRASAQVQKMQKALPKINAEFSKLDAKLRSLNPKLSTFSRSIYGMGTQTHRASVSMLTLNQSLAGTSINTSRLINQTNHLTNSMNSLATASRNARAGVNGVGRGRMGRGGGGGRGGSGGGLMASALAFGARGFAATGGAYGVYRLGKSAFDEGKEYQNLETQLKYRGESPEDIARVNRFASSQNIRGVSRKDMMEAYVDSLMATADSKQAFGLAPTLAKIQTTAAGTYGGMTHKQLQDLVRFAEIRGHGNEKRIREQLELGSQIFALSGGSIRGSELRQFVKYGGTAVSQISDRALLALEPIFQMSGGASTGTALQSMSLQLVKGQMSKQQGASFQKLGWYDTGAIKYGSGGRPIGNKFGALHGDIQSLLQNDPFGLMLRYVGDLKKQGITDPSKIENRMQFDWGRLAGRIMVQMFENMEKIQRTMVLSGQLKSGDAQYNEFIGTRAGKEAVLGKSWSDFKLALDEFTNPSVMKGLDTTASILNGMASIFRYMASIEPTGQKNLSSSTSFFGRLGGSGAPWPSAKSPQINGNINGDVYIDGKKAGTWFGRSMSGNQLVAYGSSSVNVAHVGTSNSYDGNSGTFSQ